MREILTVTLACSLLAGCSTFEIREDRWFTPRKGTVTASELAAQAAKLPGNYRLERFTVETADGVTLSGLHMTDPSNPRTVLYFGGNKFALASHLDYRTRDFAETGVNVVFWEYRGYGQSGGEPTLDTMHADARRVYQFARSELNVPAERLVLHGYSLGSFLAAPLALKVNHAGLVLESTATNPRDWAEHQVPWWAWPFVTIRIAPELGPENNLDRMKRYTGPLLILAGEDDRLTPAWMAEKIHRYAGSRPPDKHLFIVPGAGHGKAMKQPLTLDVYRSFLARTRLVRNAPVDQRPRTEGVTAGLSTPSGTTGTTPPARTAP